MLDWGAGEYERTAAQLQPAAETVVAAAALQPSDDVLDVGCGTGNATLLAARAAGRAVGLDPAERLLEVGRERAAAQGVDATFVAGDALALPFPDAAFDVVVSVFGVIFAQPGAQAAAELVRVTRPGGRIVLTSWIPEGPIAAVGRLAHVASAPAEPATDTPAPLAWGDPAVVGALFADADVAVHEERLAFTADSPRAWVLEQAERHPVWLTARAALEPGGRWADLVDRSVAVLEEGNEDPAAFRTTSRYLLVTATVPPAAP